MNDPLDFEIDGAALHPGAALSVLPALERLSDALPQGRAGLRLRDTHGLADLLAPGSALHQVAADYRGAGVRPVRAIMFDKSAAANWALGWHQDRTIAVAARMDMPGYGPWSVKHGIQHVEPPFDVIEAMVTLRVHLDDVPHDNAPLRIVRGSHRLGRIAENDLDTIVTQGVIGECLASAGDVWAYATPIAHASRAARGHRRRVLQIDWSNRSLPGMLEWHGIGMS